MKLPIAAMIALLVCSGSPAGAQLRTTLKPATSRAFDAYARQVEASLERRISGAEPFLWVTADPGRRAEAMRGEVVTSQTDTSNVDVPDGMIHDWTGAIFIPSTTATEVIGVLQDFDHHKDYYPEVVESKLLSREGNVFKSFLRLRKEKVLTVVLDTEHEARYRQLSDTRWTMRSYSTKIAEVEDAGKPTERELPVGEDSGFLWRLHAYWRIQQSGGGVWLELRTLSLTRDIPFGAGFLVKPFISSIPRESLASTLEGTRSAVHR